MGVQKKQKKYSARGKVTSGRGCGGGGVKKGPPKLTSGARKFAGRSLANFSSFSYMTQHLDFWYFRGSFLVLKCPKTVS